MANNLDAKGHEMAELLTEFTAQTQSTHACSHMNMELLGIDKEINTHGGGKDNVQYSWYIGMDGRTYLTHAPEVLHNKWNSGFAAGPSSSFQFHHLNSMQQNLRLEDTHSPMLGQIPQENQPYQYPDDSQLQEHNQLATITRKTPIRTRNPNSAFARLPRPLKKEDLKDLRKNFGKKEVGDKSWKMLTRCNYFDSFLQYYGRPALPAHGPTETWQTQRSTLIRALSRTDTKLLLDFIDAVVEFQGTAASNAASDDPVPNDIVSEENDEDISAEVFHENEEQNDTPLIKRPLEEENDDAGKSEGALDPHLQKRLRTSIPTSSGTTKTENTAKLQSPRENQQHSGKRQLVFANYKAANKHLVGKGLPSILEAANKYFTTKGLETIRMAEFSGVELPDSGSPARNNGKQTVYIAYEQIPNTWVPSYRNYGSQGGYGGSAPSHAEFFNDLPTSVDTPRYWFDRSYGGQNFAATSQSRLGLSSPADMRALSALNYKDYEDHDYAAVSPAAFSNGSSTSMGTSSYGAERIRRGQDLASPSRPGFENYTPNDTSSSGARSSGRRLASKTK